MIWLTSWSMPAMACKLLVFFSLSVYKPDADIVARLHQRCHVVHTKAHEAVTKLPQSENHCMEDAWRS